MDLEVHPSKHKLSAMRQEKGGVILPILRMSYNIDVCCRI